MEHSYIKDNSFMGSIVFRTIGDGLFHSAEAEGEAEVDIE